MPYIPSTQAMDGFYGCKYKEKGRMKMQPVLKIIQYPMKNLSEYTNKKGSRKNANPMKPLKSKLLRV